MRIFDMWIASEINENLLKSRFDTYNQLLKLRESYYSTRRG